MLILFATVAVINLLAATGVTAVAVKNWEYLDTWKRLTGVLAAAINVLFFALDVFAVTQFA